MNGSRAWFDKDFYKTLGVGEGASADEIKRAYRKLARVLHPDRNPGNHEAEEKMKDASEAYDVLSDEKKRGEYNEVRRMARAGHRPGPAGGPQPQAGFDFDLGDMFGSLFGRGGRRAQQQQRGADLETQIRIAFLDAARGVTVPVRLRRDAACGVCNGSGDASGAAATCTTCGGSGAVGENQGPFAFMRACSACGGSGRTVGVPCVTCGGSAVVQKVDEVRVKIPAGISDSARVRVRGRGGASQGGATGDLYVVVGVDSHPQFTRNGADLLVKLPMSYPDAVLGSKIQAPTLDGPVTLKIPAGTPSGKTFRVRGRGIARARGVPGDLLVTVEVAVPKTMTDDERALIEKLGALQDARASGAGPEAGATARAEEPAGAETTDSEPRAEATDSEPRAEEPAGDA